MKVRAVRFPKEMLLHKACNLVVELLVLHNRCKNMHGVKSSGMDEHVHLVGVAGQASMAILM